MKSIRIFLILAAAQFVPSVSMGVSARFARGGDGTVKIALGDLPARAYRVEVSDGVKITAADSRLGWEPSMEYVGGAEQIRWKLGLMENLYGAGTLR